MAKKLANFRLSEAAHLKLAKLVETRKAKSATAVVEDLILGAPEAAPIIVDNEALVIDPKTGPAKHVEPEHILERHRLVPRQPTSGRPDPDKIAEAQRRFGMTGDRKKR